MPLIHRSLQWRKRALLLDFVTIALALAVLFCANAGLLPQWMLIAGAIVAAAVMGASIYCLLQARKVLREETQPPHHDTPAE